MAPAVQRVQTMRSVLLLLSLSLWALLPTRAQTAQQPKAAARIYFDQAHGEAPPPAPMAGIGRRLGYTLELVRDAATTESLRGSQLVYFRAPIKLSPNPKRRQSSRTSIRADRCCWFWMRRSAKALPKQASTTSWLPLA